MSLSRYTTLCALGFVLFSACAQDEANPAQCPAGLTQCATTGFCYALDRDAVNCGTCGNVCGGATPICCAGACSPTGVCSPDQNPPVVDPNVPVSGSGGMPNVTGGAPNVTGGAPNVTGGTGGVVPNKCGTGKAECNGTCVSIMSDRNNCGACGNVCPQGALCGQGKCNSPKPGDPCGVNGGTLKSHAGVVLSADCRRYYIHNNVWINPSGSGAQTITSDPNVLSGRNFKVTNTTYNSGEWSPGAYPAIYAGCHWKACTAKQAELGLPKQAKDINSVPTTWTYSLKSGGKYNVAYDLWFNKTSVPPTNGNANGAELMIWTNYEGDPRPAGDWSGEVNINSTSWEVWVHPNLCISGSGCWRYITYKAKSKLSNGSMDLAPFVKDAKDSRGLSGDWWLTSIQAGFEIWNSGAGLATTSFATSVK